jgi:hypothetical protein
MHDDVIIVNNKKSVLLMHDDVIMVNNKKISIAIDV